MEGDPQGGAIEWIIRLALLVLACAAVWTVFGDDIAQFLGRKRLLDANPGLFVQLRGFIRHSPGKESTTECSRSW